MTPAHRATRTVWIAVLAMAALVAGPTVSRAVAAVAPPMQAHAHCEGLESAAPVPVEPTSGRDPIERCDLCAVAALPVLQSASPCMDRGVAPMVPTAAPRAAEAVDLPPAWSPASPRGPPGPG